MERKRREIALAREACAGNEEALAELTTSVRVRLAGYSRLVCRQPEDAEEVVQETLLQVIRKIRELREPEGVHAWIFRIAFNHCRMKRRKEPGGVCELEDADSSSEVSTPEELLLSAEWTHEFQEALAALPEHFRTVVMLRCLEGLSTEETAAITGVSPELVRARLSRARAALRQHWAR